MRTLSLLALPFLTLACRGVDVAPVRDTLHAAASLALAGSAAMTAIASEGPPCVSMTPSCQSAPCAARIDVTVGEACPLALGSGTGTVVLDGEWTDAETATFVPDLTRLQLGVNDDAVAITLGAIAVQRDGDEVRVTFGQQGVSVDEADGGSAGVEQAGFTVTVSLGGTPAEPGDDVMELSGGGQRVAGTVVTQLALAEVKTAAGCRDNPVSGTAVRGGAGSEDVSTTTLSFHEACDGDAEVLASTEDPTLIGRTVSLGL